MSEQHKHAETKITKQQIKRKNEEGEDREGRAKERRREK